MHQRVVFHSLAHLVLEGGVMALPSFCLDRDAVLKDPPADTKWRHTVPDYTAANALFEKYKTTDHQPGSLQAIVQNIVKNWEKGTGRFPLIMDRTRDVFAFRS